MDQSKQVMKTLIGRCLNRQRRSKTYSFAVSGTVIAGLLLLAMLLSNKRTYGYIGSNFAFLVSFGSLMAGPSDLWRGSPGWVFYDAFGASAISWEPRYIFRFGQFYSLKLWKPLAIIVVTTAVLWLRDRFRYRVGSCQNCGYNLKGNISGVCSECGTPTGGHDPPTS